MLSFSLPLPFIPSPPGNVARLEVETWIQPGTVKRKSGRVLSQIHYVNPDGRKTVVATKKGRALVAFKQKHGWWRGAPPLESFANNLFKAVMDAEFKGGRAALGTILEAHDSPVWKKAMRRMNSNHCALRNVCDVMRA